MTTDALASPEPPPAVTAGALPNTFIIGAAKSGTTALAEALRSHPQICMASRKEPHHYLFRSPPTFGGPGDERWLARSVVTDPARFAALFDRSSGEPVVAEASVYYLYRPEAIERIERERPGARYIVMLREPAARARSAYRHMVRDGRERESFEAALAEEAARIDAGWEFGWHYVAVSRYARQLERLFELVERDRVHVAFYEHFRADPVATQQAIAAFLDVDPAAVSGHVPRVNVSGVPRSKVLHRLLDRPRTYLPEGLVDRLGRADSLRRVRARVLERNLGASAGTAPPSPEELDRGWDRARRELSAQRDALASVLGTTPPWS